VLQLALNRDAYRDDAVTEDFFTVRRELQVPEGLGESIGRNLGDNRLNDVLARCKGRRNNQAGVEGPGEAPRRYQAPAAHIFHCDCGNVWLVIVLAIRRSASLLLSDSSHLARCRCRVSDSAAIRHRSILLR
jgi:hypothetical protein